MEPKIVPPVRLFWFVRFIAPLGKTRSSAGPGTGPLQFAGLDQRLLAAPVHVVVTAAPGRESESKDMTETKKRVSRDEKGRIIIWDLGSPTLTRLALTFAA